MRRIAGRGITNDAGVVPISIPCQIITPLIEIAIWMPNPNPNSYPNPSPTPNPKPGNNKK